MNRKNTLLRRASALALVGLFATALPAMFAANGPTVTVEGNVSVQGVVETINDTLNRPYAKREAASMLQNQSTLILNFNVPDGKRLIVETITFQAGHLSTDSISVKFLVADTEDAQNTLIGHLAIQAKETFSTVAFSRGTHPIKLRVDSKPGSTSELRFQVERSPFGSSIVPFEVTVHGYLTDLPSA